MVVGLPCLLLALSEGHRWGLTSSWTGVTLALGIAGLTASALIQRRSPVPLFDFGLFRSRIFTGAVVSAVANYVALFVMIILTPFYLEEGLGFTPGQVGMLLSVQPLVMALVASPSGWLSDRIGSRGLATGGMLVLAAGLFGLAGTGQGSPTWTVALWLGVMGLGTGVFISPNSSALMGSAPRNQQGAAGSMLGEARIVGMLLGVALATVLFSSAGGRTGASWIAGDFQALALSLRVAAGVALAGALAAALRGGRPPPKTKP
jgi:MFS family permease